MSGASEGGWFSLGGAFATGGNPNCPATVGAPCNGSCCGDRYLYCVQGSCCRVLGAFCRQDSDCCEGRCGTNGTCVRRCAETFAQGDLYSTACADSTTCCSGNCVASPEPVSARKCQFVEGCKPSGEYCNYPWDCCTGTCVKTGSGRTICLSGDLCQEAGELCDKEGEQGGCCPGYVCDSSPEGVLRCRRQKSKCAKLNEPCNSASDCCAIDENQARCLPTENMNATWYRACTTCSAAGESCTSEFDCCKDLRCHLEDGVCVPKAP